MSVDYAALTDELLTEPMRTILRRSAEGLDAVAHSRVEDFAHHYRERCIAALEAASASDHLARGLLGTHYIGLVESIVGAAYGPEMQLAGLQSIDRVHGHAPGTAALTLGILASELDIGDYDIEAGWVRQRAYQSRLIWRWDGDVSWHLRQSMTAIVMADEQSRREMRRRMWGEP